MSDNTNPHIINEIIKSTKHYGNSWFTISRYFLLFPLGVDLLKAKSINDGIGAFISYPIGIATIGIWGGIYGFGVGIRKYHSEVIPKLGDYTIAIISVITDELHLCAKYKIDEISKKFEKFE